MDLKNFFQPKSIAVIGSSKHPRKIGNIIFRNFIDLRYEGKIFAVNPNAEEILGQKTYPSVKDIKDNIDLAIITTPAQIVYPLLEECAAKKIQNIIIISSGFSEVGNVAEEEKLRDFIKKKKLNVVGVNCLGIYDSYSNLDTLFTPRERMDRPKKGSLSLICQSGAIGAIMIDIMAQENYGLRRFVSYGNATGLDESDFIDFLGKDDQTKAICLYIEGLRNGKKFLEICKKVCKKKPIVAIKAGITTKGTEAVKSHTGTLAGSAEVYKGILKQANVLRAESLEELFNYARLIERGKSPPGNKIQIITNGGGVGVLAVDELSKRGLELAELDKQTIATLKKEMPPIVNIGNPLDLVGDANDARFKFAIDKVLEDKNVDILLIILLPQTPTITINIIKILKEIYEKSTKPICLVVPGGSFANTIKRELEEYIPSFSSPSGAATAIKGLLDYNNQIAKSKKRKKAKIIQK